MSDFSLFLFLCALSEFFPPRLHTHAGRERERRLAVKNAKEGKGKAVCYLFLFETYFLTCLKGRMKVEKKHGFYAFLAHVEDSQGVWINLPLLATYLKPRCSCSTLSLNFSNCHNTKTENYTMAVLVSKYILGGTVKSVIKNLCKDKVRCFKC